MPQIKPTSVQDLLKFIEEHRADIENGTYDVVIDPSWVDSVPENTAHFLAVYCSSSKHAFAQNLATGESISQILALDKTEAGDGLRYYLAKNRTVSAAVLEIVARNADYSSEVYEYSRKFVEALTRHPNVTPTILEILVKKNAHWDRYNIRCVVAAHPLTPPNLLSLLAKDDHPYVRAAVVKNRNTPADVIAILERDADEIVRTARKKEDKKKSCFIATVVYGSALASEVELLRAYRDHVLSHYKLGRWFIAAYYAVSPPLARFIGSRRRIRNAVRRCILDPLVRIIRICYLR